MLYAELTLGIEEIVLPFDYHALKTAFRAQARAAGIDPTRGRESDYQLASLRAEARKRQMTLDRWWGCHELWAEWQTTERVNRSQTEDIALRFMAETTRIRKPDYVNQIVADLLREIYRRDEPLSALRERVGGNRVWRTEIHRGREMWVRYIDPIPRVVPVA